MSSSLAIDLSRDHRAHRTIIRGVGCGWVAGASASVQCSKVKVVFFFPCDDFFDKKRFFWPSAQLRVCVWRDDNDQVSAGGLGEYAGARDEAPVFGQGQRPTDRCGIPYRNLERSGQVRAVGYSRFLRAQTHPQFGLSGVFFTNHEMDRGKISILRAR